MRYKRHWMHGLHVSELFNTAIYFCIELDRNRGILKIIVSLTDLLKVSFEFCR